ncbi:MAG: DNA-binding protein [Syntrophobacteraceae bacterium]|jgi:DNA/RNA endonuclease YhcR with UshA esterase domain
MKSFKLLFIMALLAGLVSIALAQQTITSDDAAKFIGQQKTVCGTVASAHFATKSKGQPTFINLDKPYPNQVFTVLIWGSDRSKFEKPPETLYSGKEICVTGLVQSYQGRPEIIVKDPTQIKAK